MFTNQCPSIISRVLFLGTLTLLSAISSTATGQQKNRVWSDESGSFSVEASLVEVKASSVVLKKLNGVMIDVPFDRLSKFDLDYLANLGKQKKPDQPNNPKPVQQTKPKSDSVKADAKKNPSKPRDSKSTPSLETKPSGRGTKSNDKFDPASTTKRSELFDPFAPPAQNKVVNPLDKYVFEISPQEIQRLPETYRKAALLISGNSDRKTKRAELKQLGSKWPKQKLPTLIRLVRGLTRSPDAQTRKLAIDILAKHDSENSLEFILAGMDDKNFDVRWASFEWIEKLGDARAIEPLVRKLESEYRDQAAFTLVSFGPTAEPNVLRLINHKSTKVQLAACSVLAKIGTPKSIPDLQSIVANEESVRIRMQARNAIDQIKRRQNSD